MISETFNNGVVSLCSPSRGKSRQGWIARSNMTDQSANAYWRMGGITVPEVEDFLYAMLPPRDEVLAEMEVDASKNDVPIVGPAVARLLYQLATISGAKKIFEMGSAIGYSTIWWATPLNFFRRRRNNTTSSSTISIRPTTHAFFVWRFRD